MPPPDRKTRIILLLISAAIFLGIAVSFFWPILKDLAQARQNGKNASNVPLLMFGGFFLVMILMVVASVVRAIRHQPKLDLPIASQPREAKPWLARADWAAGRVKSSALGQVKIFAVMALAFCGMGGLFTVVVLPKELHNGNYPALLILLFPLVGLGFLIAIIRAVLARRRFGDCVFELAAIPGALGGTLEGLIQTGARLQLEHGLHLKLSCLRRVTTGSGKNRSTREDVLWQDEKILKADLPEPEPGHTGIPVFFRLPADQPESDCGSGDGIHWRLEAKAKMPGVDFHALFYVPVFNVAGAAAASADEADPTAALQMPIEELRRDEHSKIQVNDGPDGREFYFPAARNWGVAVFLTIFFAVWSGIFWVLVRTHAPMLFPIVWGVTDVLVAFGCVNAWFKSSRVTIDSTTVRAVNRWLLFRRTRQFRADDVVRFATKAGMQSGSQVYLDIKLITRDSDDHFAADKLKYQQTGQTPPLQFRVTDPGGVTVAGGIPSAAEANWLVQEMNNALGRRA